MRANVKCTVQQYLCTIPLTEDYQNKNEEERKLPPGVPDALSSTMNAAIKIGFALIGLCASVDWAVEGGEFSSNVVMLNSRNWRKEVEESAHAVFVNVW